MTILIDIGNSTVVVAVADDQKKIVHTWRFKTRKEESSSFYYTELYRGMRKCGIDYASIKSVILSSVVPELNDDVSQAVYDLFGITPHLFSILDAMKIVNVDVESPSQIGCDRIADAAGAVAEYGAPIIVFDMGTATTVGVINEKGCFIGGMIIPGVKTSLNALSQRASQLPSIDVQKPRNLIGRNTLESMQSGIVNGTAAMLDGIIDRIEAETGLKMNVVATGGMARHIAPLAHHDIKVDEFLQFKGLLYSIRPTP